MLTVENTSRRETQVHAEWWSNFVLSLHLDPIGDRNDDQYVGALFSTCVCPPPPPPPRGPTAAAAVAQGPRRAPLSPAPGSRLYTCPVGSYLTPYLINVSFLISNV